MRFVISVVAGLLTGIISAWGIGGGSLLIIYMSVFGGVPQQSAQGINLLYFLPTSATALFSHLKNRLVETALAWPAILAGAATTFGASLLVTMLDTQLMKKIFGVFIIFIGLTEVFKKREKKKA